MTDLEWAVAQGFGPHVAIVTSPDGRVGAVNRNDGPDRRQFAVVIECNGPRGPYRAFVWSNVARYDGPGRWLERYTGVVWTECEPYGWNSNDDAATPPNGYRGW